MLVHYLTSSIPVVRLPWVSCKGYILGLDEVGVVLLPWRLVLHFHHIVSTMSVLVHCLVAILLLRGLKLPTVSHGTLFLQGTRSRLWLRLLLSLSKHVFKLDWLCFHKVGSLASWPFLWGASSLPPGHILDEIILLTACIVVRNPLIILGISIPTLLLFTDALLRNGDCLLLWLHVNFMLRLISFVDFDLLVLLRSGGFSLTPNLFRISVWFRLLILQVIVVVLRELLGDTGQFLRIGGDYCWAIIF